MISRNILALAVLAYAAPAWAQDGTAVPEGSHVTLFALGLLGVIVGRRASMSSKRRKQDND
jgi:hypothetical protein